MKRVVLYILPGIAALLLATGTAHAEAPAMPPRTTIILWALEADTKRFEWTPAATYETLQECLSEKKELEDNPIKNKDAHGFTRPLKCIRYRR
jgi:hypothetical protein